MGSSAAAWAVAHGEQRHDAGAAGDELHGAGVAGLGGGRPDEERPERPVHLDHVAGAQLVDEVRRDLAVGELVDGELHAGRRPDDATE